jgi:hypothetical protein
MRRMLNINVCLVIWYSKYIDTLNGFFKRLALSVHAGGYFQKRVGRTKFDNYVFIIPIRGTFKVR